MSVSRQRIERFVTALISEETFDDEEGVWLFADGSPCSVCVSGAKRIAREFEGGVFGYWSKANPCAAIGRPLCEGHDFAVIAERWIVDYWAFHVARVMQTPVLDLESPQERQLVSRLLGEREAWEALAV